VLDAPFSPDAASGTVSSWQWRDYAPSKLYHNIYFGTQTDHVWFGWNSVNGNGMACRGVLFHSTGGRSQYDLHVHDNVIHDTVCDGIDFATVDPSQGVVEAYNNVIYNAGRGPDPIDGPASYAGIFNPGITHLGTSGSGDILIYNNTLYNCGNNPAGLYPADRGAIGAKKGYAPNLRMALTNNILVQTNPSIPYFSSGSNGAVSGSSNDCWGGEGGCPAQLAHSLRVDPGFVNPRDADFRILADSPVRQAKLAAIQPATDQDGHVRPPKATIGAFEPPSGKTGGQ